MGASSSDLESLIGAIMRLVRDANRLVAESFDQHRVDVLRLVATGGPIRWLDIATTLDIAPSAVVRCLRGLEEQELVTVVDTDGRPGCLVASATMAGREEVRQVADAGIDMLRAVTHDWSRDEVTELASSLRRLADDWQAFQQASARKVQSRP